MREIKYLQDNDSIIINIPICFIVETPIHTSYTQIELTQQQTKRKICSLKTVNTQLVNGAYQAQLFTTPEVEEGNLLLTVQTDFQSKRIKLMGLLPYDIKITDYEMYTQVLITNKLLDCIILNKSKQSNPQAIKFLDKYDKNQIIYKGCNCSKVYKRNMSDQSIELQLCDKQGNDIKVNPRISQANNFIVDYLTVKTKLFELTQAEMQFQAKDMIRLEEEADKNPEEILLFDCNINQQSQDNIYSGKINLIFTPIKQGTITLKGYNLACQNETKQISKLLKIIVE